MHVLPIRKPTLVLFSSLSLLFISSTANSAGFAIIESSASGMGKAFAGAAAAAEDASTVWFNPAGMTYLGKSLNGKSQITQAGHIVSVKSKFTDKGSQAPAALNATLTGKNADDRVTSFIPNLYYVHPINDRLHFGVGMNGPFGSKVLYEDDWIGRYQATDTDLLTINVNPSLSWKVNERLSIGGGISAQYVKLKELSSAIDSVAVCRQAALAVAAQTNSASLIDFCNATYPNAGQAETDTQSTLKGDDVSFGYNLGLLFEPSKLTRIGLSYRSKIKHEVDGNVKFKLDPGLLPVIAATGTTRFDNRDIKSTIELPDSLSFSVAHKVNDKLELLGDVTWTGWQSFDELRVTETDGVTAVTVVPQEWDDVFRFSIGANYKYSDKLTLRTGVAFDEEPIPSAALRTPRIPGNDRTWVSFGAGYKINKKLNLDFGYSHLFLDETPIDNPGENGFAVRGLYDSSVEILSAQVNYNF
ncbi:MAG: outer membrane protein transport protein [Cocleimonas sp.]